MQQKPMEGTKWYKNRYKHGKMKMHRPKGIRWDFDGDGQFTEETIPKYFKRKFKKNIKKKELKQLRIEEGVRIL